MKKIIKVGFIIVILIIFSVFGVITSAEALDGTSGVTKEECRVSFYLDGALIHSDLQKSGERAIAPSLSVKDGYELVGWSLDASGDTLYDFNTYIMEDTTLYAVYRLSAPTFSLSSLSFVYDGMSRSVVIEDISHPLRGAATITFEWYKDRAAIPERGDRVYVRSVSDSGRYSCRITFTVDGDSVSFTTPTVDVSIAKAEIEAPTVAKKTYNGLYLTADIESTSLYRVDASGGVMVGAYPVKVQLIDTVNYKFVGTEADTLNIDFVITRAENYFSDELRAYDVYEGDLPSVSASAGFGEVEYLYSASVDGVFSATPPLSAGSYYVIARVQGTENYTSIESSPVPFSVIGEEIVSAEIHKMPDTVEYVAFDRFSIDGLSLRVKYNSTREEIISSDRLCISYQSDDSFRYGHTAVIVSYLGFEVSVPVTVSKRAYDISSLSFSDSSVIYNGEEQSISYSGDMPIGLDGIMLECTVLGSGKNVGVYSVVLVFSTESTNYLLPPPITAELLVSPYEARVEWSGLWFVYDGSLKCPEAYYIDIYGRKNILSVSGARSQAGEYTVLASSSDTNYKMLGASVSYTIARADYDMSGVYWEGGGFTYDGLEHRVTAHGLPDGVSVIGYIDNKAITAGSYVAKAVLSYDNKNYNPPAELVYQWRIARADYDMSGLDFCDTTVVFDTKVHYPTLIGSLPIGIDGVELFYEFSTGVTHVSEGRRAVEVIFYTRSINYNAPDSIVRFVEILPLGINIIWQNTSLVYNGEEQSPSAICDMTDILISGAGVSAGVYTASCVSLDPDYYIINSSVQFTVQKASNAWTTPLSVCDIFEGSLPSPSAECISGEIYFVYYSDPECNDPISAPTSPGRYYVVAKCDGTQNYTAIVSRVQSFEIIKILPVSFFVEIKKGEFSAFEKIISDDFSALVKNNDGSIVEVGKEEVHIIYNSADSLRYGDQSVTFGYLGFSYCSPIKVKKADYDMSGVVWTSGEFVYDGTEKSISLIGLPQGVTVVSYIGDKATLAGEHRVEAILDYDKDNYNEPSVEHGLIKINKQTVPFPEIPKLYYNSSPLSPDLSDNGLYTVAFTSNINAGVYYAELSLRDKDNYRFADNSSVCYVPYEIAPMVISVKVLDVDKYLFEEPSEPSYLITSGESLSADELNVSFFYVGEKIFCKSNNKNYTLSVTPGRIIDHKMLSSHGFFVLFIVMLIVITVGVLIVITVLNRRAILHGISMLKCRLIKKYDLITETQDEPNLERRTDKVDGRIDQIMTVSPERADSLITDSLAKSLLRKGSVTVYTDGNKKGIINVDILSAHFTAGDSVDVNLLKQRNLVPYDTAYIKVLARGILDKPLKVYANEFSLSAVKMIALTGGEAVRVNTVRKKDGGMRISDK